MSRHGQIRVINMFQITVISRGVKNSQGINLIFFIHLIYTIGMAQKINSSSPQYSSPAVIDLAALDLWLKDGVSNSEKDFPIAQLLQLILDNIPQEIFWKDRNSVYVWCNRKFAIAAGVGTPDKIVGKTDYDLAWTKEQSDWFRFVDQRVMNNKTIAVRFLLQALERLI